MLSAHSLENIHVLKHCGRTTGTSGTTGGDGVPLGVVAGTDGGEVVMISSAGEVEVAGDSPAGTVVGASPTGAVVGASPAGVVAGTAGVVA